MTMDYKKLTARQIADSVACGRLSATAVVKAALGEIEQRNTGINAFVDIDAAGAISAARSIDRKVAQGRPVGPLAGVPIANKANICRKGLLTTCCSKILSNFRPPYSATVIRKIEASDGIVIGNCNMDEFAMGSSTEFSVNGPTRNPFDPALSSGGSSGGSCAAVAGGMVPLALGSDTGGSIRQPASLCGVVGFKPTYGRVSRNGLVAFASSFDAIGTIARNTADAKLLFDVIQGQDVLDSTSVAVTESGRDVPQEIKGLRLGAVIEFTNVEGIRPEVLRVFDAAITLLRDEGAVIDRVSLPLSAYAVSVYHLIAQSEASTNMARYDGVHFGERARQFDGIAELYANTRGEFFGDEVKRRILLGTFALSEGHKDAYYLKAARVRTLIAREFATAFEKYDFLISPATPSTAFALGELVDDPLAMYLCDLFTLPANIAGITAISLPCGSVNALPAGFQIMAPAYAEESLLGAAELIEGIIENAGAANG